MTAEVLYRIKPVDKKSIELLYDVYKVKPDGTTIGWSVTELYRWGQGFVEADFELPYIDSKYICVSPNIGDGCELEDLISIDFKFDDDLSIEEKEEIEKLYCEGDSEGKSHQAWLFDGEHEWQIDDETVTIYAPFVVDKIIYQDYNILSEESVKLQPRPAIDPNSAWPFK